MSKTNDEKLSSTVAVLKNKGIPRWGVYIGEGLPGAPKADKDKVR